MYESEFVLPHNSLCGVLNQYLHTLVYTTSIISLVYLKSTQISPAHPHAQYTQQFITIVCRAVNSIQFPHLS